MDKKTIMSIVGFSLFVLIFALSWLIRSFMNMLIVSPDDEERTININYGASFMTCALIMTISIGFGVSMAPIRIKTIYIPVVESKESPELEKSSELKKKETISMKQDEEMRIDELIKEENGENITITEETV